jgi:DNA mismatch endonuclease, patch repair protein
MADSLSSVERSRLMARIQGSNTSPERVVRSIIHSLGYRHRKNQSRLPGTPDVVIPSIKLAIFVHGCFWHRHSCKRGISKPETRRSFWERKFEENVRRDRHSALLLRKLGWSVAVIWECQTKPRKRQRLESRLRRLLENRSKAVS